MIDKMQLEVCIIRPALAAIGLLSDEAVALLLGTAAQETQLGTYIVQKGMGYEGGIGIYQMQAPTYFYVWHAAVDSSLQMQNAIKSILGYDGKPPVQRLASDLFLATIMCRLHYKLVPEKIPQAWSIPALAAYYKKYWNTLLGKATEQEFIDNYNRYVKTD